jgi:hypothetical protein
VDANNPLRRARLERGLSLEDVITQTRLSPHLAQKIDTGRFSELPPGLYARAYVRAVAKTVGLDPESTLAEVNDQLPGTPDPMPVLREVAERTSRAWQPAAARCAAAALDGAIIGTLVSAVAALIGLCSGVAISPADASGRIGLAVLSAIVGVPYFLILAGVAGRTPGQHLVRAPAMERSGPVTLADIRSRATSALLPETPLLRDLYSERFCGNVTISSDGWS